MNVLLHICCGPCAIEPFHRLQAAGHEVTGYFYNPNIHPLIEFRRRLKAVRVMQERLPIPVECDSDYGLRCWMENAAWRGARTGRCASCYRLRLRQSAQRAAERGCKAFTTTLLASRQQDHALVKLTGEEAAEAAGVEFLYADWRKAAERSHERAREMRLYLQSYCGCIFSEQERFAPTNRHVYRGPGPQVPLREVDP